MSMNRQSVAVEILSNDHPRLTRSLRNDLTVAKAQCEAALVANTAQDFADYKYRCGHIRGLAEAITLCEEIEKDLRGD